MHDERIDPDLNDFAERLSGLRPVRAVVDRDHVMFAAGEQSQRRQTRRVAWTSAVLGVSVAAIGVLLPRLFPPDERIVERIVYRQTESIDASAAAGPIVDLPSAEIELAAIDRPRSLSAQSNFHLRRIVLLHGVDALPDGHRGRSPSGGFHRPASRQELLDELLGS